tara:strand:- start:526 stop:819 length:294 start_codon:yes stop_codon:yes gene_type:complete
MQNFNNPLTFNSLANSAAPGGSLLDAILTVVMVFSTPIIVFFLILSGFLYVTARGNPEQLAQARRALMYGLIGGVVILGAFAISAMITGVVGAFATP